MTQRYRLIEILADCFGEDFMCNSISFSETSNIADYLLENGVIVPSVKVGQIVYALWDIEEIGWRIKPETILGINILGSGIYVETEFDYYKIDEIGREVFLTKGEAEKALAERNKDV